MAPNITLTKASDIDSKEDHFGAGLFLLYSRTICKVWWYLNDGKHGVWYNSTLPRNSDQNCTAFDILVIVDKMPVQ